MEETLARSRCGLDTVFVGQKALHSRYNPLIEAERYLDSLKLNGDIQYIILAECGLCYLIGPLRNRFPAAKIISLHIREFFRRKSASMPDAEWLPDSPLTRGAFLENEIADTEASRIKIIEWRPSADAYGAEYLNLVKDIAVFVKRADANKRTRVAFGRRWLKNVFRNCFLFNNDFNFALPARSEADCVVAGAGPGLEDAYRAIRRLKESGAVLIAVSSATSALLQAGLCPDIVVACDGGNWALLHLFEIARYISQKNPPVSRPLPALAFSLNAAVPSQCAAFSLLPLGDGSLFQNLTQKCFDIPQISFPQRGTVGASALDLAFYVSGGTVYTAGIQFSHKDIRVHAKPYALDKILSDAENRLRPLYSLHFERSEKITASGVNKIYSDWFDEKNYKQKTISISETPFDFSRNSSRWQKRCLSAFSSVEKKRTNRPVTRFVTMLNDALRSAETKERLAAELSDLLSEDGIPPAGDVLQAELMRVSEKYRKIEARNE
ncbi:MAG: DUF115 domain-containing protein [Spirochaetaceae bacterium]|jgi:hypothetical protein|nr:DUF115 domain-containing protein [Spirochaetaceae bacterium]